MSNKEEIHELASGGLVELSEMTGQDVKDMTNRSLLRKGEAIPNILKRRVDTVDGENPPEKFFNDMLGGDSQVLLFLLRKISYGEEFIFSMSCDSCQHKDEYELDLNDFELKSYKDPAKRVVTFDLSNGDKIQFNLLTVAKERKYSKIVKEPDGLTKFVVREFRRVLFDEAKEKETLVNIKWDMLPVKLLAELAKKIDEYEGGIDSITEVECTACGKIHEIDIMGQRDFFFPSGI